MTRWPAAVVSAAGRDLDGLYDFYDAYEDDGDLLDLQHRKPPADPEVRFQYAYNAADQRTQSTVSDALYVWRPTADGTTASAADAANRIIDHGGTALSHDANGNLTFDGVNTFGYDAENRLISAATPTQAVAYAYDPTGRRAARTVDGATTLYLWSGASPIADYDGATGLIVRRYIPGPGIDEPVAMIDAGGNRHFYHADGLGSVAALTDDTGAVVGRYAYAPWGEGWTTFPGADPANPLPEHANPFRFAGYRFEPATGLYHLRARDYSPALGRFLQTDPIGYADGLNLYAYVGNDPLNFVDPSGLFGEAYANSASSAFSAARQYLSTGASALSNAPGDFAGYAHDFVTDPVEFAQRAGPTLGGLAPAVAAAPAAVSQTIGFLRVVGSYQASPARANPSTSQERAVRSLTRRAEEHERKLNEFRANPTVRPGMENQPSHMIRQQQQRRIQKLEKEIDGFYKQIQRIIDGR